MENRTPDAILKELSSLEKKARIRTLIFTMVPVLLAIILLAYITRHIATAQNELDALKDQEAVTLRQNKMLTIRNDSLSKQLMDNLTLFGQALSVVAESKKFIDNIKPPQRTASQAAFYINMRMYQDKISADYDDLSKIVGSLPKLDEGRIWIVIVQTSLSLEDLKRDADLQKLINIYGKDQIAIYHKPNKSYVLCVKGNGTFTRAYRLNVDLKKRYGYFEAYFSGEPNWGTNYLYPI